MSINDNISDKWLTEIDIRNYIMKHLPTISYEEMWEIRNQFVYDFVPLEFVVERKRLELQFKNWNKSKNKNYYNVPLLNGGRKIVYMCKEQVEFLYKNKDYRKVG